MFINQLRISHSGTTTKAEPRSLTPSNLSVSIVSQDHPPTLGLTHLIQLSPPRKGCVVSFRYYETGLSAVLDRVLRDALLEEEVSDRTLGLDLLESDFRVLVHRSSELDEVLEAEDRLVRSVRLALRLGLLLRSGLGLRLGRLRRLGLLEPRGGPRHLRRSSGGLSLLRDLRLLDIFRASTSSLTHRDSL